MVRQTGITTQQMLAAPIKAVYIWPNNVLYYPTRLARLNKRQDLWIVSHFWLTSLQWQGRELTGIVIDHATQLSDKEWEYYHYALSNIR